MEILEKLLKKIKLNPNKQSMSQADCPQNPERRAPAAGALETWTRGLDRIRYLPAGEVPELLEDTK